MIPVLKSIHEVEGLSIFETHDRRFGLGFEIEPCDLETDDREVYQQKLISFIRGMNPNYLSRIQMKSQSRKTLDGSPYRKNAAEEVGFSQKTILLFVEIHGEPLLVRTIRDFITQNSNSTSEIIALSQVYDLAKQVGLKLTPVHQKELTDLIPNPKEDWMKEGVGIKGPSELIGVIRLQRQLVEPIDEYRLANILTKLPEPFEIHVSWKLLDAGKVKIDLERRLKQTSTSKGNDPTEKQIMDSTIQAITSSLSQGSGFVEFEFLVLLKRNSESSLREDLKTAEVILNQLAEFKIESFGAAPSFLSTLLGNSQHVTLREVDETFCLFLPVWLEGEKLTQKNSDRSLPLLRNDKSLFSFDLFNKEYSVYNSIIVGTSGKGKSVLTGLLTQSLLNDPNISVIKVDVGGSHSKECELFGGSEYVLQLGASSGINPFDVLKSESSDSGKIGILSRFLSVLIQEQGEIQFSKEIRSQIEECIKEYIPQASKFNLQEFYDLQTKFPRRNLLRRWVSGGAYESAFSETESKKHEGNNRLRYYNFSQVFQASDPEFAQAGLAAVLAQFNIETLKNDGKRIVLICDETPFFIKSCFDFFKFSTANVRKFGHAVVLITQLSSDLIVNGDTGIIENSPQRFLFSVDGKVEDYQSRFGLNDLQMKSIKSLKAIPQKFSEVFLQTGDTGRKLRIEITRKEYWELTSSMQDRTKLADLRKAVPSLSLKEAIACLSLN